MAPRRDGDALVRAAWVVSLLLIPAAGTSAVAALWVPEWLHGPAVMVGSMRGTAAVVAGLALPILVAGMAFAGHGSVAGLAAWIGAVVFIAYQGWMFLFAVPFNGLFLVYVAMFGLASWALVCLAIGAPAGAHVDAFSPTLPARPLAAWMIGSCLGFYALWLKNVVPASFDSAAPAFLAGSGMVTATNYVLDMALFLPFTIVVAIALWRRTAWGLLMGGAMLLMLLLEAVAIAVDQWAGSAADPGSPVASASITPLFLVVALIGLVALGAWYRGTVPARVRAATAGA